MKISYIVVSGNPCDGFDFTGPFASAELANEWAEDVLKRETWWVAELHSYDTE